MVLEFDGENPVVFESSEASRAQAPHRAESEKIGRESMRRGRGLHPRNAWILYAYLGKRVSKSRVQNEAAQSVLPKRERNHTVASDAKRGTSMSSNISGQNEKLTGFLRRFQIKLRCTLGAKLIGIYIHGSVAQNAFRWERSDVDALAVVSERLTATERLRFVDEVRVLSKEGPAKGIEVSVLTEKELIEGAHPYVTECHYSPFWDEYVREAGWENWDEESRRDEDITSHIFNLRQKGIVLEGPEITELFPVISRETFMESIAYDEHDAPADMVDSVMNLCRYHCFLRSGALLSKEEGLQRMLPELPDYEAFLRTILREFYAGTVYLDEALTETAERFKEEMLTKRAKERTEPD